MQFVFWLERTHPAHKWQGANPVGVNLIELRSERAVGNVGEEVNAEIVELLPLHRRGNRFELNQEKTVRRAVVGGRRSGPERIYDGWGGRDGLIAQTDGFARCSHRGDGEQRARPNNNASNSHDRTELHEPIVSQGGAENKRAIGLGHGFGFTGRVECS